MLNIMILGGDKCALSQKVGIRSYYIRKPKFKRKLEFCSFQIPPLTLPQLQEDSALRPLARESICADDEVSRSLLSSHMFRECELTFQDHTKGPDSFVDQQHYTIKFDPYIIFLQVQKPLRRDNMDGGGRFSVQVLVMVQLSMHGQVKFLWVLGRVLLKL